MKISPVSFSGLWKLNGHKKISRSSGANAYKVKLTYYPFADETKREALQNIERLNKKVISYQNVKTNHFTASSDKLFYNKVTLGKPLSLTSYDYLADKNVSGLHDGIYTSHGPHQFRVLDGKEEKMAKAVFF